MAVEYIEEYKQKNGEDILKVILKSTREFFGGYFYCDAVDKTLAEKYNWHLRNKEEPYVAAVDPNYDMHIKHIQFHKVKAPSIFGCCFNRIIHINGVAFDNITKNLDEVDNQQYHWSKPRRGYIRDNKDKSFQPYVGINRQIKTTFCVNTEVESCILAYWLEVEHEDYRYNFLKDRRDDPDILDLERTGRISEDEADYRHVCRYALNNAWYIYRYNLFEYFRDNHLRIPDYSLNEERYMVHSITNQRLCPI